MKWYGKQGRRGKSKRYKIWKIQKKIPKWYGKYGRKTSQIMKRYGHYGRNPSWIVKRNGKYGRKLSWILKWFGKYGKKGRKDQKNTEENSDKICKIFKKGKLNSGKILENKMVATFVRNVIIEINNVIMKIKWRGRGR